MAAKGRKQGTKTTVVKKPSATREAPVTRKMLSMLKQRLPSRSRGLSKANEDGFEAVETCSDGNCLFRAVSAQLYDGVEDSHMRLRQDVVQYQRDHASEFLSYVTRENCAQRLTTRRSRRLDDIVGDAERLKLWNTRMSWMSKSGSYGDMFELIALTKIAGVQKITVYSSSAGIPTELPGTNMPGMPSIGLYLDETAQHYWGLRKLTIASTETSAEPRSSADHRRYLAEFRDDDNLSIRSSSSKRSFSQRDDEDAATDEEAPRKKNSSDSRQIKLARRPSMAVGRRFQQDKADDENASGLTIAIQDATASSAEAEYSSEESLEINLPRQTRQRAKPTNLDNRDQEVEQKVELSITNADKDVETPPEDDMRRRARVERWEEMLGSKRRTRSQPETPGLGRTSNSLTTTTPSVANRLITSSSKVQQESAGKTTPSETSSTTGLSFIAELQL